jgi:hypothetical protein
MVIGAFPSTRLVKLIRPEVIRQVGLIWVEGNPMLPMARAMLGAMKSMATHEWLPPPASPIKIRRASHHVHGAG